MIEPHNVHETHSALEHANTWHQIGAENINTKHYDVYIRRHISAYLSLVGASCFSSACQSPYMLWDCRGHPGLSNDILFMEVCPSQKEFCLAVQPASLATTFYGSKRGKLFLNNLKSVSNNTYCIKACEHPVWQTWGLLDKILGHGTTCKLYWLVTYFFTL